MFNECHCLHVAEIADKFVIREEDVIHIAKYFRDTTAQMHAKLVAIEPGLKQVGPWARAKINTETPTSLARMIHHHEEDIGQRTRRFVPNAYESAIALLRGDRVARANPPSAGTSQQHNSQAESWR